MEAEDSNENSHYYLYVLKESNNLFRAIYTDSIGTIEPNDLEYVCSNVTRYGNNYILTVDRKLYDLYGNLVATNVKDYSSNLYLSNDNELHFIDREYGNVTIAENVKKFDYEYYLTNDDKLYTYLSQYSYNPETDNYNVEFLTTQVLTDFKELIDEYTIITNSNELYTFSTYNSSIQKERDNVKLANYSYYVGTDNKLYQRSNNSLIGTDVKILGGNFYLTNSNKLQDIWNSTVNAENVKSFEEYTIGGVYFCVYKTLDNSEYFIRGISSSQLIPEYDEFQQGYYSKNNNLYCIKEDSDYSLQNNIVAFGVFDTSAQKYWCQLQNKNIYYDLESKLY